MYALGQFEGARLAFAAVLATDPTDAGTYQILSAVYAALGRKSESESAQALYYAWRDDLRTDSVAVRFFAARPEWADERIPSHSHGNQSPGRPTLSGQMAAPVK